MPHPSRRDFLKTIPLTTLSLGPLGALVAGPFTSAEVNASEGPFIPADKKLGPKWLASLYARGERRIYRGDELKAVGMPIGGICAGQVYLAGDGRLAHFEIFNQARGNYGYATREPQFPIAQGFTITANGVTRPLDRVGFPGVTFVGEYPIGRVTYDNEKFPLRVTLEAFSPFIPLNAADSALPATVMQFKLENRSAEEVKASLTGFLENAVCFHTRLLHDGNRVTRALKESGLTILEHSAERIDPAKIPPVAPPTVFADFEGDSYGDWKTEGAAFGSGPAHGTFPRQQPVTDFFGKGLVNSYKGGDRTLGKLISPTFEIQRPFINFLIGGGKHDGKTCMNLVIDEKVVRSTSGGNAEKLDPAFWDAREFLGKQAHIEIVDAATGPWGHVNVDQIEFADRPYRSATPLEQEFDFGTMALAVIAAGKTADAATRFVILSAAKDLHPADAQLPVGDPSRSTAQDDGLEPHFEPLADRSIGAITHHVTLKAGESRDVTFILAWHFPNRPEVGNFYATRFDSASSVARYIARNLDRLAGDTRLWHDTYYDSTLPHWLLDRLHMPVSTLATGTSQWWKTGRYWAWEGVGCCEGTCTHVYNYAQATAFLFPELERSARQMQDFGAGFHDNGLVGFRGNDQYAADGQCGTILKAYREHRFSKDDEFLQRNWPRIRQAMQFLIDHDSSPEGGANWRALGTAPHPSQPPDGVIVDPQHNTYDIWFHGPNSFIAGLYLAALRAAEEMAKLMRDDEFAATCAKLFKAGSTFFDEKLFDGEYYIQLVDLKLFPEHQYDHGCLSDQLFGQNWATMLDLGYVAKQKNVRSALKSIYRYNWTPDVGAYNLAHPPGRWFARAGEAGLITCTFPKSEYLKRGVLYREEVWTGIEYQVASHMLAEGMLQEALTILRGIHERYDASKRNPWNEIECGDHYSRAMASWGCILALSGFHCDGPAGAIHFSPNWPGDEFRGVFTTASGWGTFANDRGGIKLTLRWGTLALRRISVGENLVDGAQLMFNGRPVAASRDDRSFSFDRIAMKAGDTLSVQS